MNKKTEDLLFTWFYKLCFTLIMLSIYYLMGHLVPPTRDSSLELKFLFAWRVLIVSAASASTVAILRLP